MLLAITLTGNIGFTKMRHLLSKILLAGTFGFSFAPVATAESLHDVVSETVMTNPNALIARNQRNAVEQEMEQARNAYTKQFRIGQRTLLDVLDSENELFTARIDYANGIHDVNFSVYRILAGNGKLLWALQVPVPEEAALLQ